MATFIDEVLRFIDAVSLAVNDCKDYMANNRNAGSYKNCSIASLFISGTGGVWGIGGSGDYTPVDLGTTGSVYLHFKLPITSANEGRSFLINGDGYAYGDNNRIIDVSWSGRIVNGTLVKMMAGSHSPNVYLDSNGNVVISLFFNLAYYVTMSLDSMAADLTSKINNGQVVAKVSLTPTTTF